MTSAKPAAGELVSSSIGCRMMSTVPPGAMPWTMSRSADVVFWASPNTPRSDTRASSAGKKERTE